MHLQQLMGILSDDYSVSCQGYQEATDALITTATTPLVCPTTLDWNSVSFAPIPIPPDNTIYHSYPDVANVPVSVNESFETSLQGLDHGIWDQSVEYPMTPSDLSGMSSLSYPQQDVSNVDTINLRDIQVSSNMGVSLQQESLGISAAGSMDRQGYSEVMTGFPLGVNDAHITFQYGDQVCYDLMYGPMGGQENAMNDYVPIVQEGSQIQQDLMTVQVADPLIGQLPFYESCNFDQFTSDAAMGFPQVIQTNSSSMYGSEQDVMYPTTINPLDMYVSLDLVQPFAQDQTNFLLTDASARQNEAEAEVVCPIAVQEEPVTEYGLFKIDGSSKHDEGMASDRVGVDEGYTEGEGVDYRCEVAHLSPGEFMCASCKVIYRRRWSLERHVPRSSEFWSQFLNQLYELVRVSHADARTQPWTERYPKPPPEWSRRFKQDHRTWRKLIGSRDLDEVKETEWRDQSVKYKKITVAQYRERISYMISTMESTPENECDRMNCCYYNDNGSIRVGCIKIHRTRRRRSKN